MRGFLTSISHNTDTDSANDVTYNFVYDEFGNTSSVKVGTQALISHTYGANNGLLLQSTYGNGDTYTPTYDSLDRISSVSYNSIEKYNWEYGADGRIGLHNDLVNDVTWRYEYTKDGSLTSAYADSGERFTYTYEPSTGKLLTATVFDGTTSKTTTYNYSDHTNGEDANLIESVVLPTATVTYDYDGFYRTSYDVEVNSTDILTTDYTFVAGSAAGSTTTLVESMTNTGNGWSETRSYTRNCKGSIETISENGTQKAKYYYDSLNQLIREDNAWLGKTIEYTYDNGGNIQLVEEYAYTSGAIDSLTTTNSYTYLYGDSNWKDKLTSYNGNAITYDEIGNPLTYYNGFEFDWKNGRRLAGISGTNLEITYAYNANGIRTSKTVNGITTTYTLEGSNVVKETNGSDTIWYHYDATGGLTGFEFNGVPYFYINNAQGDITAIADASGNKVVEYLYDSWGKPISITGLLADSVGTKNSYRYRGYRYDVETGLYYVASRYYDPEVGRWINSDGYASTGCGLIGNNSFAYCNNNPICYFDPSGCMSKNIDNAAGRGLGMRGGPAGGYAGAGGYTGVGGSTLGNVIASILGLFAVSKVSSSAGSNVISKTVSKDIFAKDYTVYFLKKIDDKTDTVIYVGRVKTANFDPRMAYHRKMGREKVTQIDNLNYLQCRALEQGGMMFYHTINNTPGSINNKIRGVGPNNDKRKAYLDAAKEYARSAAYGGGTILPASYWENLTEEAFLNGTP